MSRYQIIAQSDHRTVVAEFKPRPKLDTGFQSEQQLEAHLIDILKNELKYEYVKLSNDQELIDNLRSQLQKLNNFVFTDDEWQRFFEDNLGRKNLTVIDKTRIIQETKVFHVQRTNSDGAKTTHNIRLIDDKNICNNRLQVINQFTSVNEETNTKSRYDVSLLINGLPLVHIELKRRGKSLEEAFNQIQRYQRTSFNNASGLFEFIQIYIISNGTQTKYFSNTTYEQHLDNSFYQNNKAKSAGSSFAFTSWWADAQNRHIADLEDFAFNFLERRVLLNVITKYCVFTADNKLKVMRPYQIAAAENIVLHVISAGNNKAWGTKAGGGYIWHTTGSGKTLTSFKTARLLQELDDTNKIDKVLFVVDRKDLDKQTIEEFNKYKRDSAIAIRSNTDLKEKFEATGLDAKKIIVTTIQKLSRFVVNNKTHPIYGQRVVLIFDECHRSQFGEMHQAIVKRFKKYHLFGFTGTPIFAPEHNVSVQQIADTTQQVFGCELHKYTIVDAINDGNVLPFRIETLKTFTQQQNVVDKQVQAIDTDEAYLKPERITGIVEHILKTFNKKTHRDVNKHHAFNGLMATSSIAAARRYFAEFQRQLAQKPENERLKIAMIYSQSLSHNNDGTPEEENVEDTSGLNQSDLDALKEAISVYNAQFRLGLNIDSVSGLTDYYTNVSGRLKDGELDLLIVVNMFLTGFDAPVLNTLWVDKPLREHGLIQAFSRTNRILDKVKNHGNIVCFRNLQEATDAALKRFGNKNASNICLLRTYDDYYNGYKDEKGVFHPGYQAMVNQLLTQFALPWQPVGEQEQKKGIELISAILRRFNLLRTFDEFTDEQQIWSERQKNDYLSYYQDLRAKIQAQASSVMNVQKENINDDLTFELEIISDNTIGVDYINRLVERYLNAPEGIEREEVHDDIMAEVCASPQLRSKKELIREFLNRDGAKNKSDWDKFIDSMRKSELDQIIQKHGLKAEQTKEFMNLAFENKQFMTTGTAIDNLLPPMSRRTGMRADKKNRVIEELQKYYDRYWDITDRLTYGVYKS